MGSEEFQEVREPVAMEGVDLDPPFPKSLKVSNIVRRAVLWGYCETLKRLLALKASSDGALLVYNAADVAALEAIQAAVEGTLTVTADAQIPDGVDVYTGTAADAYSAYQAFDGITKCVTVLADSFGLDIMFKDPAEVVQDAIWVPADTGIALALKVHSFRLKNHTGGSNCEYQVIGSLLG